MKTKVRKTYLIESITETIILEPSTRSRDTVTGQMGDP